MSVVGLKRQMIRFLDTTGDGTGDIELAVDGSITPKPFFIRPAENERYVFRSAVIRMVSRNWENTDHYGMAGRLINGIEISAHNTAGDYINYTEKGPIRGWADWLHTGGVSFQHIPAKPPYLDSLMVLFWEFNFVFELVGIQGDYWQFKISDDLTPLAHMEGSFHGELFLDE